MSKISEVAVVLLGWAVLVLGGAWLLDSLPGGHATAKSVPPVIEERRPPTFDACDESTYTYIWSEAQGEPILLCLSYGYGAPVVGGTWVRCWGPNEEVARTAFVNAPIIVMPYELPK